MFNAISYFKRSFERIDNIDTLYLHLVDTLSFNSSDLEDLLRSQVVYSVSAFDKLVHDLTLAGMLEILNNQRAPTAKYLQFPITVNIYNQLGSMSTEILFKSHIQQSHKHLSFQDPDKVSEALSLFWDEEHKWQKIATHLSKDQKNLKIELKNIVFRRNQIVHESDIELSTGNTQRVERVDARRSVDFIKNLGESIYDLVKL